MIFQKWKSCKIPWSRRLKRGDSSRSARLLLWQYGSASAASDSSVTAGLQHQLFRGRNVHCITKQNDVKRGRILMAVAMKEKEHENEREGGRGKCHCSHLLLSPPLPLKWGLVELTPIQLPPRRHTITKRERR